MGHRWPPLPYEEWSDTCDTIHAHTQVLGKLAVALAPPEPQLQHAALRLTARGWETLPLPAPDGSGAFVAIMDLQRHEAVVEHGDGRSHRVPFGPDRPVGEVTRQVMEAVQSLAGAVEINPQPQEVGWTVPLDEDDEHRNYDPAAVSTYLAAATRAALVLAKLRAPYRGRSSPVNAWWGSFDLSVSLYSGLPADPPSSDFIARNSASAQQIEVGWWPGDPRYPRAAFYAFAVPAPPSFSEGRVSPEAGGWNADLGEFVLDWDDVVSNDDPFDAAVEFGRSVVAHACTACDWDPSLAASAQGVPPAVT
ncbi:MAG TPA: DUF5996 family protein [Acidimicrobiales bacterium]|nr:DUF5996 family protein [Acidimicrobiales bacterium]